MKLSSIYNQIKGNRLIGLSLIYTDDGLVIYGSEFFRSKEECKLVHSFEACSLNEISGLVSGKYPVIINVDGNGILHKKINTEETSDESIAHSAFPGINLKDFWFQRPISGSAYFSICKKEIIHGIVNDLKEYKLFVTNVYLGAFTIEMFTTDINSDHLITIPYLNINLNEDEIYSINRVKEVRVIDYEFYQEIVSNKDLCNYCSVIYSLGTNKQKGFNPLIEENIEEANIFRIYTSLLFVFPPVFLIILCVNYILFSFYSSEVNEASYLYSKNEVLFEQLKNIEAEISQRNSFWEDNFNLNSEADIRFCDLLAQSLPTEILLTNLQINPIYNKIKKGKEIEIADNEMLVAGEVAKEEILREWIQKLNELSWIEKVNIKKYLHSNDKPIDFQIQIKIACGELKRI